MSTQIPDDPNRTAAEHLAQVIDLGFSLGRNERLTETQRVPHGTVEVFGRFSGEYAAKFARESYLTRWQGYGVVLSIRPEGDRYVVSGYREDSCE